MGGKERRCRACGEPLKGHHGPAGLDRCTNFDVPMPNSNRPSTRASKKNDVPSNKGDSGSNSASDSNPCSAYKKKQPESLDFVLPAQYLRSSGEYLRAPGPWRPPARGNCELQQPVGSGTAEADSHGPVPSPSAAHFPSLDAVVSSGGAGPHMIPGYVGRAGGRLAVGVGSPATSQREPLERRGLPRAEFDRFDALDDRDPPTQQHLQWRQPDQPHIDLTGSPSLHPPGRGPGSFPVQSLQDVRLPGIAPGPPGAPQPVAWAPSHQRESAPRSFRAAPGAPGAPVGMASSYDLTAELARQSHIPGLARPGVVRGTHAPLQQVPVLPAGHRPNLDYMGPSYSDSRHPLAYPSIPAQPGSGEPDFGVYHAPPGTEHVTDRVRSSVVAGEFVELSDLLNCVVNSETDEIRTVIDSAGNYSLKPVKPKRCITTSFKWLESWTIYEILLANAYGLGLFTEMANYRIFIISLFAKYKLPYVLCYDCRHRQQLGARRSFNFNYLNQPIYVTTFDSTAIKASNRCSRCNSPDHPSSECPFRAAGQASDLPRGARRSNERSSDRPPSEKSSQLCYQYQEGLCRAGNKCPRRHQCMGCGGPDGHKSCSKCQSKLGSGQGSKN